MTRILGGILWVAAYYQMYKQFKIMTSSAVDRGLSIYIRIQLCLFLTVVQWASHFITGAWASSSICAMLSHFSRVQFFATLWTVACQTPLFIGFFQARILKWIAISSSRESSQPRDQTCLSCFSHIAGKFFTSERQTIL